MPFFVCRSSVRICTVSDALPALQHPLPVLIAPPRGLSGIECRPEQRVQRPGVCVVPCVVCSGICPPCFLAWSALLPVLCSLSGCAGGWGLHLWGIWVEPGVGWSTPRVEKIQKRRFPCLPTPSFLRKSPPPPLPILKISRKNKKTPTKGLCSVLYLPYKP